MARWRWRSEVRENWPKEPSPIWGEVGGERGGCGVEGGFEP